jgi:phosphate transport system permease protein
LVYSLLRFFWQYFIKGLPAFWQSSMTLPVYFDPAIIMQVQNLYSVGESPAHLKSVLLLGKLKWVWWIGML